MLKVMMQVGQLRSMINVYLCLSLRTGKDEGSSKFGRGSGTIWLDEVGCLGTEDDIVDCYHRAWGSNDCSHSEDVGISCSGLIAAQPSTKPSVKNETGIIFKIIV